MRHRKTKKHIYAENENLNLIQYDELKLYKQVNENKSQPFQNYSEEKLLSIVEKAIMNT